MPDISQLWTSIVSNPLIQLSVRLAGLYILAIYLAMVFWTVRDAQQRTENQLLPYLAGLMVVILNIFGLFLYLIVRPKETLGEAYERQLAEESLLAEAEQRVVCPTCKERVQEDYILCPTCRTRLERLVQFASALLLAYGTSYGPRPNNLVFVSGVALTTLMTIAIFSRERNSLRAVWPAVSRSSYLLDRRAIGVRQLELTGRGLCRGGLAGDNDRGDRSCLRRRRRGGRRLEALLRNHGVVQRSPISRVRAHPRVARVHASTRASRRARRVVAFG